MTYRAKASFDISRDGVSLFVINDTSEGKFALFRFDRQEFSEGQEIKSLLFGNDAVAFMQAVMDAGYEYGLRPSNARDEKDKSAHLKDMREIARHLLKMDAPKS